MLLSHTSELNSDAQPLRHPQTRDIIISFLERCNLPFPVVKYDKPFEKACCATARKRGYPLEGPHTILPFMPAGVVMATTAYAHLPEKSVQIYIALYTAFLVYLDDVFQADIGAVKEFNERFAANATQENPSLQGFANLLRDDTPKHFGRVVSNLIVTSTLNLVTALLLEHETQDMVVCTPHAIFVSVK